MAALRAAFNGSCPVSARGASQRSIDAAPAAPAAWLRYPGSARTVEFVTGAPAASTDV